MICLLEMSLPGHTNYKLWLNYPVTQINKSDDKQKTARVQNAQSNGEKMYNL